MTLSAFLNLYIQVGNQNIGERQNGYGDLDYGMKKGVKTKSYW